MTFKFTDTRIGDEIFRLAVEACPCGMVVTDGAGTIVLANSEAETLFQYQRGELIGQPLKILVPGRFRAAHQ